MKRFLQIARCFGISRGMRLRIVVLLMVLACGVYAANVKLDSLKVGSRVYSNVTVLGVNETDIYIRHSRGLANIKLKYLSPELQETFHYDEARATEVEQQQAEDDKEFQASIVKNIETEVVERSRRENALPPELVLADAASERSLLNRKAPALTVEKWLGEQPATEGKFLLISFWLTTSAPSSRYLAELNSYHQKFKERLVVIGISSEPESDVAAMAEPKIEFASAIDSKRTLADAVDATSVPYIVFIDPKGLVRYYGNPAAINEQVLQAYFKYYAAE